MVAFLDNYFKSHRCSSSIEMAPDASGTHICYIDYFAFNNFYDNLRAQCGMPKYDAELEAAVRISALI